MNIGEVGLQGEKRVAAFLRQRGFNVIKRNYQCRYGEIDIIAENGEYILFVEVKTRAAYSIVSGAEAVDFGKMRRVRNAAIMFSKRLLIQSHLLQDHEL